MRRLDDLMMVTRCASNPAIPGDCRMTYRPPEKGIRPSTYKICRMKINTASAGLDEHLNCWPHPRRPRCENMYSHSRQLRLFLSAALLLRVPKPRVLSLARNHLDASYGASRVPSFRCSSFRVGSGRSRSDHLHPRMVVRCLGAAWLGGPESAG